MKLNKLENNNYEIINDDYVIYISKEQNPNTELYLYFVDVFEHNNKNAVDSYLFLSLLLNRTFDDNEIFDDLYSAIEYIENNFEIPKTITKQIKFKGDR